MIYKKSILRNHHQFSQLAQYFTDHRCRVGKLKIELGSIAKIPFHTLSVCWFYKSNQARFSFVHRTLVCANLIDWYY